MVVGACFYEFFNFCAFLTPWLIFLMLLLTFCKISFQEIHFRKQHFLLLLIAIFSSLITFLILNPVNQIVAQGAMLCLLAPTATAAVVITGRLGGNMASITTYTLLVNIAVALLAPAIFPIINPQTEIKFFDTFFAIAKNIVPLMILPFLISIFLQKFLKNIHQFLGKFSSLTFYLWTLALAIATAKTIVAVKQAQSDLATEIGVATAAALCCAFQFFVGKTLGSRFGDRIACGQAFGQKNTILAIWMASNYLNPVSAIGPGSYVIWQNLVNSYQLYKKQQRDSAR